MHPGDLVILIGYGQLETAEAKELKPQVVFVDADNHDRRHRLRPGRGPARRAVCVRGDAGRS